MRVYIASSFDNKVVVEAVADVMMDAGHTVTVVWWTTDFKTALGEMPDEEWYRHPKIASVRWRNFLGIDDADALIIVSPKKRKYNGANVELGYAIAKKKIVVAYGELERCAMYQGVPQIKFESKSTHKLLDYLQSEYEKKQTQPTLCTKYYCAIGKRAHPAYYHVGRGTSYIWCKTHGILATITGELRGDDKNPRMLQMTKAQEDRFRQKVVNRWDRGKRR